MTPAQAKAMYARQIGRNGETVTLRRDGDDDRQARAFIAENTTGPSDDLAQEGRRVAIVLAEDVETTEFPLPFLERQDRVIWGGGDHDDAIQRVRTRRVAGEIIAYELELEGT